MRPTKVPGGDRVVFSVQSKGTLQSRRSELECQFSQLCDLGEMPVFMSLRLDFPILEIDFLLPK